MTDKALDKYENIIILRDISIDIQRDKGGNMSLLTTSVKLLVLKIWLKRILVLLKPSSVDILLTNQPRSFMHSLSIESGMSDVHMLIVTHMRAHIKKLKPIQI